MSGRETRAEICPECFVPSPHVLFLFRTLKISPEREIVLLNSLGKSGSCWVSGECASYSNN